MNLAIVIGNLGADAEIVRSNGSEFVALSIAETRKFKKQDGTEVTETSWVDAIINDVKTPVLPFLKQGVKVCVVGRQSLRVYSSKKDRRMKAGQTISVMNIELCGGGADDVPRQLVNPKDGTIVAVSKHYYVNPELFPKDAADDAELIDKAGKSYVWNKWGWVSPMPDADNSHSDSTSDDSRQENAIQQNEVNSENESK